MRRFGAALFCVAALWGTEGPEMKVIPRTVRMGAFYSGEHMRIEGTVRAGSKVIVVIRGQDGDETFNRKHKAGLIWINSGKVHVTGVPSLFLRFSDGAVRYFLSREAMEKFQLDEAAIKHQMHIEPLQDTDVILASWLTLKAQEGRYELVRDGVKMGPPRADGRVPYRIEFEWPKKAPPGTYFVRAYECRDWHVVGVTSTQVPVVTVGFPSWLASMSRRRAFLYGIIAVIAAAIAGFGIDILTALIFGKKKATAH